MKQQSMDGRAYCGKHALIGSERPLGCGRTDGRTDGRGRSGRLAAAAAAAAADTRRKRH